MSGSSILAFLDKSYRILDEAREPQSIDWKEGSFLPGNGSVSFPHSRVCGRPAVKEMVENEFHQTVLASERSA